MPVLCYKLLNLTCFQLKSDTFSRSFLYPLQYLLGTAHIARGDSSAVILSTEHRHRVITMNRGWWVAVSRTMWIRATSALRAARGEEEKKKVEMTAP